MCVRNLNRYVYPLLFKRNENQTLFFFPHLKTFIFLVGLLSQWPSFRCVSCLFLSWVQVVSLLQMREHLRALNVYTFFSSELFGLLLHRHNNILKGLRHYSHFKLGFVI